MEVFDAIITRRSIRKFINKEVDPEIVKKLLKAAMYAPTANNYQSWQFLVINDRKILNEIPKVHPYSKMLHEATLAILVCGDENYEKIEGYNVTTCVAATQNLLLAAHSLGLGTCWLGIYPREVRMKPIIHLFKLPQNIIPVTLIAIGYPNETKETPERFKPERIHYNKW